MQNILDTCNLIILHLMKRFHETVYEIYNL